VSPVRYADVRDDRGFTLLELLVAFMLVAIVMTAMVTFLVSTTAVLGQQRDRQAAIQLADNGMELVRAKGTALAKGRVAGTVTPAPGADLSGMNQLNATGTGPVELPVQTTQTVAGVTFQRYIYLGTCFQPARTGRATVSCTPATGDIEFYRVVVAVTWSDKHCAANTCSYVTSTLVSCGMWTDADPCSSDEPAFRVTP
jgi:prepilin-type N-terminal cleavage/methylation domain-containing protein